MIEASLAAQFRAGPVGAHKAPVEVKYTGSLAGILSRIFTEHSNFNYWSAGNISISGDKICTDLSLREAAKVSRANSWRDNKHTFDHIANTIDSRSDPDLPFYICSLILGTVLLDHLIEWTTEQTTTPSQRSDIDRWPMNGSVIPPPNSITTITGPQSSAGGGTEAIVIVVGSGEL